MKLLAFSERLDIYTKLQQKQQMPHILIVLFLTHQSIVLILIHIITTLNQTKIILLLDTNQMVTIQIPSLQILILSLLIAICISQTHFTLNQPAHFNTQRRHLLNDRHNEFVIHHNMRVFNFKHQSHLQHEAVGQNYGLNDMGYFFSLNLTIANLPYSLNIDTGSSDIFIKGEHSKGNPQNKYTCPTCLKNNQKVSIGYLDGFLSTYKATLPVQIGQHHFNQSILVAYSAPHNFQDAQGLVGLSFPQIARNNDPTFIQTLINNKIIDSYSFGVNLNFQQHKRSFISFGTYDSDLFEGDLKKYSISSGYSYSIAVKGVSIGDGQLYQIDDAILDTGNTCISIPNQFEQKILSHFNTQSNICGFDNEQHAPSFSLLRCKVKNYDELPVLKIHIGQDIYEVDKDVYMQRCIKKADEDLCDTYVESVKFQEQLFLGDGFFNRYYAFFDLQNRQIGFAKNKQALSHLNMYISESQMDNQDKVFFSTLQRQ